MVRRQIGRRVLGRPRSATSILDDELALEKESIVDSSETEDKNDDMTDI